MAKSVSSKCHPCRAKGMEQINYFITPERKSKFKHYCHMKGVSMTSMLNSLAARELESHYDKTVILVARKHLHDRAKAYRYLHAHRRVCTPYDRVQWVEGSVERTVSALQPVKPSDKPIDRYGQFRLF